MTGSTVGAASLHGATLCSASANGASAQTAERIYQWTPTASYAATISTCGAGTSFDTIVYVREGSCTSSAETTTCNDDACRISTGARRGSRIEMNVEAGTTYYIFVDGFEEQGDFTLAVVPPCSVSAAPACGGSCDSGFACSESAPGAGCACHPVNDN